MERPVEEQVLCDLRQNGGPQHRLLRRDASPSDRAAEPAGSTSLLKPDAAYTSEHSNRSSQSGQPGITSGSGSSRRRTRHHRSIGASSVGRSSSRTNFIMAQTASSALERYRGDGPPNEDDPIVIDIIEMTNSAPDVTVRDGEPVIVEGERARYLVVLVEGTLEVRRRGRSVVRMSEPGTIVGELGLLLDTVASADVIAIGDCVIRRMEDAERTFAENPAFARHLASLLAHRLWQISTYLSDLQAQYADRADTLALMPAVLRELLGGRRPPAQPGSEREPESPY